MIGNLDLNQFEIQKPENNSSESVPCGSDNGLQLDVISRNRRKQDVLAGIERLPALPNVVYQVIRLANDPNSRAEDFVSMFSNEQTLTAKLLRIVNSPFYGIRSKVTTIPKAIVILGHKTLKSLVLASSSTNLFKKGSIEYGFAEEGLWLHSVAVARLARHLAQKWLGFPLDVADELFVVGLMHDIGKIVMGKELSKYPGECHEFMASNETTNVCEMERAVLATDHCEVGESIIKKWNIGDDIANAISQHHAATGSDRDNSRYNATLVLADLMCNEMKVGLMQNYCWANPIPDSVLAALNLNRTKLQCIRDEAENIVEEAKQLIVAME